MCGAGALPARMAAEARRQGWRITAFTFGDGLDLGAYAERTVPSRLAEVGAVLATLQREGIGAVLLSGKFLHQQVLSGPVDAAVASIAQRAGSMTDRKLLDMVVKTLTELGVEVLDQRQFLGDPLAAEGWLSAREPTAEEWRDVRFGLGIARMLADAHVGQAVVVKRGAVLAVEALEGTTEAILRGTALAGAGAVIVKATAHAHDYRLDTPTIGIETIAAAVAGRAAVLAVETGRVAILDRDAVVQAADAAGLSLLSVDDGG